MSVQAQTWEEWELIVVDDGSTDDSVAAIPADSRVRVVSRSHSGNVALVRNAGLALANGAYIGFLDSDDRWPPGKLTVQVARLEERSECGWCHGPFRMIDEASGPAPFRMGAPWQVRDGNMLREILTTEASIALSAILVRRTLMLSLSFDEAIPFGDDYDLLIRLARRSAACAVEQVVAEMRDHDGRGSRSRYDHFLGIARAYRKCARELEDIELRRLCRQRARGLLRIFLANGRAAGALTSDLRQAARMWYDTR
jgi:glycosyltransferase involved in cell wall biosynthesis